ncbi:hypothetical protein, partial [Lacrimispora sp.]|uniref:hypothetical protein n=1 Tax=Lacrimispora sp. TaxID=2719234 RepID=UPI0028B0537A
MKKKSNELRGRLTAMALAVVMCLGTVISSLAAGDPIIGTEAAPAAAAITKNLIMPEGTTTPAATFTFQFSPVSVDDRTTSDDLNTMPAVGPTTLAFSASDTGTVSAGAKNGVNGLYVAAVASSISVNDSSNQTSDPGDKVDPTPQPGDPNITGNYSKIIFTNTYSKTAGGVDPTDPNNHVLTIGKAVSGDYADRTKYFAFQITATQ